jgi:hypothetical protein
MIALGTLGATLTAAAYLYVTDHQTIEEARGKLLPVASATAQPVTQPVRVAPVAAAAASAASAPSAAVTISAQEYAALTQRLTQLEGDVRDVLAGLRAKGYLNPATAELPMDFKPYPVATATAAVHGPARGPVVRRVVNRPPARPPVLSEAPIVQPANQLLAVDLWDGKPSVVVGTGVVGDTRVKVLQEGESLNGVTLQQADVANRQATFKSAGHEIRLSVPAGEP